jgi:flagellar hook-length control protein FliK
MATSPIAAITAADPGQMRSTVPAAAPGEAGQLFTRLLAGHGGAASMAAGQALLAGQAAGLGAGKPALRGLPSQALPSAAVPEAAGLLASAKPAPLAQIANEGQEGEGPEGMLLDDTGEDLPDETAAETGPPAVDIPVLQQLQPLLGSTPLPASAMADEPPPVPEAGDGSASVEVHPKGASGLEPVAVPCEPEDKEKGRLHLAPLKEADPPLAPLEKGIERPAAASFPLRPETVAAAEPRQPAAPSADFIRTQPQPASNPLPAAEQVSIKIAAAAGSEERHITIRLDPPELGRVEVRLETRGDAVRVVMAVERPDTLDLLRRDAQLLDAALQRANVRLDGNLEFSLRQGPSGWGGASGESGDWQSGGRQDSPGRPVDLELDIPPARSRLQGESAMDIIV